MAEIRGGSAVVSALCRMAGRVARQVEDGGELVLAALADVFLADG